VGPDNGRCELTWNACSDQVRRYAVARQLATHAVGSRPGTPGRGPIVDRHQRTLRSDAADMDIVERHVVGKHPDPARCEDIVVTTDHLVAVIDGATDKSGRAFHSDGRPVTGGRFAALQIAAILREMKPGMCAEAAVASITEQLDAAVQAQAGELPDHDRPCASAVVYDAANEQVWRVGDCSVRIDGVVHIGAKRIDTITSEFRAAYFATLDEHDHETDPGREVILPLLRRQAALANRPGEFGYGVINGTPVPEQFIEVFPVPPTTRELVLASDGYPTLPATLACAEDDLAARLAADPCCVGQLRSTKGLTPGARSFDDRAWVRLRP